MKGDVAGRDRLELRPFAPMELRQVVERHRRVGVVFGVERHVPGEEPDESAGQRGACIFPKILHQRQAGVLGKQIGPEERLAEEHGKNPVEESSVAAESDRQRCNDCVDRKHDARLAHEPRFQTWRHECRGRAPGRISQD
jgi:hypothetical protein